MSIYTVRDKLKQLIEECDRNAKDIRGEDRLVPFTTPEQTVDMVDTKYLRILAEGLIKENRRRYESLLADVEVLCMQAADASWKGSADRQGGSFDASEYDRETW